MIKIMMKLKFNFMNRLIVLFIVTPLIIISCDKEKDDNNIDEIVFSGITMRDNVGNTLSQDTNDWQLHDNWTDKENSLFFEKMNGICSTEDYDYYIISYPNPCSGMFFLHLSKPNYSRLAFRIVDKDFNILLSRDSITSTCIAINIGEFNVSNEIVRIYYKFFGQNCELKGHGDIKIE